MSAAGRVLTEYSPATVWAAEGARVGLVTCLTCGAAVLLSPEIDVLALHDLWHAETAPARTLTPEGASDEP